MNFDIDAAPQPVVEGDNIYAVGAERVVSANIKTGKINWKIDEDQGFPVDWGIIENTIYLKVGYQAFNVSVDAKSGNIDAKKAWNKDPYRSIHLMRPMERLYGRLISSMTLGLPCLTGQCATCIERGEAGVEGKIQTHATTTECNR